MELSKKLTVKQLEEFVEANSLNVEKAGKNKNEFYSFQTINQ